MSVTFKSFTATSGFTNIVLHFELSEVVDTVYWYMDGIRRSGNRSNVSSGEFSIVMTSYQKKYTFQLEAIKDGVSTWSNEVVASTLEGCSGIDMIGINIDDKKITLNLDNNNLSDVLLSFDIFAPSKYGGVNEEYIGIITKRISNSTGVYTWSLTESERNIILTKMRYCLSARIFITAISYIPEQNIQLSENKCLGTIELDESIYAPKINNYISTRDTLTTNIISDDSYLIQNISSLNFNVLLSDIQLNGNAELHHVKWKYTYYMGNSYSDEVVYNNQSSFQKLWEKHSFTQATMFAIEFEVFDSRGLSSMIRKQYTILSYHKPVIVSSVQRIINSGGYVNLNFTSSYSRLKVNNVDCNLPTEIMYGYSETNMTPIPDYELPNIQYKELQNTIDKEAYYNGVWLQLDDKKNYRFVFMVTDKISTSVIYVELLDGTPIVRVLVNGQVSIGRSTDISETDTLLFIGGDVMAVDIEGKDRKIFDTMSNLITLSSVQPEDQIIGGIWLKSDDD